MERIRNDADSDGFVRADAEVLYDTPEKREAETNGKTRPLMRRHLVAAI